VLLADEDTPLARAPAGIRLVLPTKSATNGVAGFR